MTESREEALDPRTGMILIILAVFVVFLHTGIYTEWIFVGSILFLMYRFGIKKIMVHILISYLFLSMIQIVVIPNVSITLASVLSVFLYFKMIFPCGAMVALFCGTTSVRALLEAFRRMHIPMAVSVSIAVSARYFPTLMEEAGEIWNAMRLRNIKGLEQKIESMYVPLLMSAVKTGEELAQSAIVRGIENPVPKTSLIEIRFRKKDVLTLTYFGLFAIFAIVGGR